MKKLLMCSAAIALGLAVAVPAKADGIKLDLAGHFKGYVYWLNQDTSDFASNVSERHVDIARWTEIHFTGETTLDNGLTVGVHHEAEINATNDFAGTGPADSFVTQESYAYFSGAWGRVNFGKEDGANYLLQVAAPSADENFDGLRQYINPVNVGLFGAGLNTNGYSDGRGYISTGKLDYSNDATGYSNKLTYLTPVFSGFQAGVSYTPDVSNGATVCTHTTTSGSPPVTICDSTAGVLPAGGFSSGSIEGSQAFNHHSIVKGDGSFGSAWEGAVRYEGKWQELGVNLGGGYTHASRNSDNGNTNMAELNSFNQWNLGAAMTWQQFGLGVVYTRDNGGIDNNGTNRTWVVGADYTTGPFKIGASWLNNHQGLGNGPDLRDTGLNLSNGTLDTNRYAGGVVYTYGPGMTFRGSLGYVKTDIPDESDGGSVKGTDMLLGTQINF